MIEQQTNLSPTRTHRRRRGFWVKSAVLGLVTVGVLSACGHRGGSWHHDDSSDPSARLEHMVDKIFSRVDATDEQKSQITTIANSAYKDLAPMRTEMKAARGQALQLLTADTIDGDAIDTLRSSQAQKIDGALTRATSALTDIAKVLTPEQRAQVREKMSARMDKRHKRGFWHRS